MRVTPIDATAAGMNLKQFNFYSTPTRENCPLVEISTRKKTGHLPFKGEKEKKRVRERKKRGGYLTQVVQTKMFFFLCPRKSETKFSRENPLFFYSLSRGRRKAKREREREREEKDSCVVVSLTSSSSWVVPRRRRREKCSLGCGWLACDGGGVFHHHQQHQQRL